MSLRSNRVAEQMKKSLVIFLAVKLKIRVLVLLLLQVLR